MVSVLDCLALFLEVGGIKSRLSYGLYSRNDLVVLLSHVEV